LGRRARGNGSIFVIRPAVAGAHEQLRPLDPAHGAAKMPAVDAEGDEFILTDAPEPCRGFGGDAGPGKRRRIHEVNFHGLPDAERLELPHAAPFRLRRPYDRRDEEADNRNAGEGPDCGRTSNAYSSEKPASADVVGSTGLAIHGDFSARVHVI